MPDTPKAASEAAARLLETKALGPFAWYIEEYGGRDVLYCDAGREIAHAFASFHAAELRKIADHLDESGIPAKSVADALMPLETEHVTAWLRAEAARWEAT